jgi:LacI family transcriptional regulator
MAEPARPKLADIAAQAHTSVATVSKVLNGRAGVSDTQRAEILRLLDAAGYRRRGRSQGQRRPAHLIDVVVRGIDTTWATQVLLGAEEEAARVGTGIVVTVTHGRDLGTRRWVTALAQRRTDGLILVASRLSTGIDAELAKLRIPYVMVDPIGQPALDVPVVGATNFAGGLAATEHLLGLGHRRIGIITGPRSLNCSLERLDGYRAALGRAGITPDDHLVRFGDFLPGGGEREARALLHLKDRPTAIFAGSDYQAFGVYQAARDLGLAIPDQLSVVGFDDMPICQWLAPPLTTVHQPVEEMAREATRILIDMTYRDIQPSLPKLELATSLVVRASAAPH